MNRESLSSIDRERGKAESVNAVPNVAVEAGLTSHKSPYLIEADQGKIGKLFVQMGLTQEEINGVTLRFKGRSSKISRLLGGETYGHYSLLKPNEIVIFTDWFVRGLERNSKTIERFADSRSESYPNFSERVRLNMWLSRSIHRYRHYLKTAPPERAVPFVKNLLERSYQRRLDSVLVHEAKHLLDFKRKSLAVPASLCLKVATVFGTIFILDQLGADDYFNHGNLMVDLVRGNAVLLAAFLLAYRMEYKIDPLERRARKEQRKFKFRDEFRNMIKIGYGAQDKISEQ